MADAPEKLPARAEGLQRWRLRFVYAYRGLMLAVRQEESFRVHLPAAMAALLLAGVVRLPPAHWAILLLSIAGVLSAELLNSGLERLAAATSPGHHPLVGQALDMAAGAVLVASVGAVGVGITLLGPPLWGLLSSHLQSPV
jgi:diacylglycerol kinase